MSAILNSIQFSIPSIRERDPPTWDPQQKTAAPAVAGYIPEYSETPHSGSFDIAQHGLSSDDVARLTAEGRVNTQNNKSSRTLWSIMRAHLFTVFNFVLGACGAVVIMYQRWADLLFRGGCYR